MGLFNKDKDKWVQVIVCGNCGYVSEVQRNSLENMQCRACRKLFDFEGNLRKASKIKYGKKNKQGIWYFRDDS